MSRLSPDHLSGSPDTGGDAVGVALRTWLDHVPRVPSGLTFDVSDLLHREAPSEDVVRILGEMMLRNKADRAVLEGMADVLGWPDAMARLRRSENIRIRRGDFGEALAAELLEAFERYTVPIRKMRYQTDPDQTLHGTDIAAFEMEDAGRIRDLHFVESKLRTVRDLAAAVDAHRQLAEDRATGYADTLMFLADRLHEIDPALLGNLQLYLSERDRPDRGSYGIFLVFDKASWQEDTLVRLHETESLLHPLHVRVCQIDDLQPLIELTYDAIGADVMDDGE